MTHLLTPPNPDTCHPPHPLWSPLLAFTPVHTCSELTRQFADRATITATMGEKALHVNTD